MSFPTKSNMIEKNTSLNNTDNNFQPQTHAIKNRIPFTFLSLGNANASSADIVISTEEIIFQMIKNQLPEYQITLKNSDYDSAFNKITSSKNTCLLYTSPSPRD